MIEETINHFDLDAAGTLAEIEMPDVRPPEGESESTTHNREPADKNIFIGPVASAIIIHAVFILLLIIICARPLEDTLSVQAGSPYLEVNFVSTAMLGGGSGQEGDSPALPIEEEAADPEPKPEPEVKPEPEPDPLAFQKPVEEKKPKEKPHKPKKNKPDNSQKTTTSSPSSAPPGSGNPLGSVDVNSPTGGGGAGGSGGSSNFWKAVSVPKPTYPSGARQRKEEGLVTVLVEILPSGRVENVKVINSSGFNQLDEAAVKAAHRIRFKAVGSPPARTVAIKVPYKFVLKDA